MEQIISILGLVCLGVIMVSAIIVCLSVVVVYVKWGWDIFFDK